MRARLYPESAKGDHVDVLNELLRFFDTLQPAPATMFPRPWQSRQGALAQVIFGLRFLLSMHLNSDGKLMVITSTANTLRGEILLADRNLRALAFRSAYRLRCFFVVPTNAFHPVARVCALLTLDLCSELEVYVSIRPIFVFFACKDGHPVVVHLVTSEGEADQPERHRHGLQLAKAAWLPEATRKLIPQELLFSEIDGYRILVQSRLPGLPMFLAAVSDPVFYATLDLAFEPLLDFRSSVTQVGRGPDYELLFEASPLVLDRWPELREMLAPLIVRLQAWQRQRNLSPTLVHGDYWIRNVLFDEARRGVTGIVDWEWSRPNGTPGLDALHLALRTLAMERDREFVDYLAQAWAGDWESALLANYVKKIQQCYSLNSEDISYLAALLFLEELYKLHRGNRSISNKRMTDLLAVGPTITALLRKPSLLASQTPIQ